MSDITILFNGEKENYYVSEWTTAKEIPSNFIEGVLGGKSFPLSLSKLLERDENGFYRAELIFRKIKHDGIFCDFSVTGCRCIDSSIDSIYSSGYDDSFMGVIIEEV